jgi:hypothetical protein
MMEEKTNYQISTSVNEGILEIVITGELTKDTFDRTHAEVISIVRAKNPKALLFDIRLLKRPPDQLAGAYFRVRGRPPDVRRLPSAIVDPSANADYRSFYETTAANVGHPIKFFTDIEDARAWLKSRI